MTNNQHGKPGVWLFPHADPLPRNGKTLVMGIVNLTPDSFSGQNAAARPDRAVDLALAQIEDGADIVDLGAESSRPGARPVDPREEIARLGDSVEKLRRQTRRPISVDTYHPETADHVLVQGADIINDITALRGGWSGPDRQSPAMAELVRQAKAHVVLMHMPGPPSTLAQEFTYDKDVVGAVRDFLSERVRFACAAGIPPDRVWLDPGFGFGKNFPQNRTLLNRLKEVAVDNLPVLAGLSRKRLIGDALGLPPEERLEASLALAILAAQQGAAVVRCHDVKATARCLAMLEAMTFLECDS